MLNQSITVIAYSNPARSINVYPRFTVLCCVSYVVDLALGQILPSKKSLQVFKRTILLVLTL
jgi:hypothetical protein